MHNYKGNLRREYQQDFTPTKSSWEQTRQNLPPPQRYDSRNEHRYEQKPQSRYDSRVEIKNQSKYEPKYEKSELSYYQSQSSRVYYEFDPSDRPSTKSQVALGEDKYCYNRVLPVTIKSFDRQKSQDLVAGLRIQIQERSEKSQRQINIYLTDDSNPKFLWLFTIKQIDFMNLKSDQKLKVSYQAFPEMLQNCLRECESEDSQRNKNFLVLAIKKGGQGKLSFVQSTKYKESTHLQFNFKLANDEQIKDYLSVKLLSANEEIEQNRITIRNMEHTLNQRMKEIQRKSSDLNSILNQREQIKDQFKLQLNQKRTQLQSNKLNQLTKVKKQSQIQIKQLKQKLTSQIQILSKHKTDLSNKLSQAKQRVATLQSIQREQSMKILRLENDYNKSNKQSEQLRVENRDLSQKRFQNQKTITQLTCKIESLRSQLQDKKTIISSTVQLKETNNNQINSLEQQTTEQKKQIIRLQNKISELQADVLKLTTNNNQYIEKISIQKEKLKERGEIMKEQQKDIKQLQKKELFLERQKEKLQHQRQDKDSKIKSLHDQLQKMQKKFQDQQAMVAYLQKNLNQRPGLRAPNYYPTNTYQASSSYSGLNRQLPSQLSTNSNIGSSRVAVTASNNTNQRLQKQKYEPNIKRYEDRSKSPLQTRLPQQKEPEEQEQSYHERPTKFQKPFPVKFKMSQPKQS